MTLGTNPSLFQIADEFSLAHTTPFPSGFYGLGGAPASGPMAFSDFNGRSATSPLSASASPTSHSKGTAFASATTNSASTVTPSGGTAPYTYLWGRVSGSFDIDIDSSTTAATTFSASGLVPGDSRTTVFRCTVTDSSGTPQTALTNTVTVTIFSTA